MKKTLSISITLIVCAILLNGCASAGLTASSHLTNVQLTNPNFRIVATNVSGQASGKALFGLSYGFGIAATQVAIIPLNNDRMLYKAAMKNLWANFEASNGVAVNRKLALVNVRYDSESLNTFFYTKLTTAIIADVIEFQ